ncbi:MAG: DNA-directed RNA polymerase subunit omega [Planctomycetota bacterium]
MIEKLRNDDIMERVGGRFKLTALIQKRWLELMRGARPMIEHTQGKTEMEIVVEEIAQGKIAIDYDASGIAAPVPAPAKEE